MLSDMVLLSLTLLVSCLALVPSSQFQTSKETWKSPPTTSDSDIHVVAFSSSRRSFISSVAVCTPVASITGSPELARAKSYSANARNLERINSGDMSAGSQYDNNPTSEAGKRRRAMTGCKSAIAREVAAKEILNASNLSEKDCNQKVLNGNPEFMLRSLRSLDCPSCPYGIATGHQ